MDVCGDAVKRSWQDDLSNPNKAAVKLMYEYLTKS